jgi:hypothetical protein
MIGKELGSTISCNPRPSNAHNKLEALTMEDFERHSRLTEGAKQALLREIPGIEAALLRIREALDDSSHECEACHFKVKHSFRDSQATESIRGIRYKLRLWEEEAGGRKKDGR